MNHSFFPRIAFKRRLKGMLFDMGEASAGNSVWQPMRSICIVNIRAMRPLRVPSIVELRKYVQLPAD